MAIACSSLLFFLLFSTSSYAQFISTTTPVPPLQWLELTSKLTGTSKPPPLKDSFISYDQTSRTVIIFGGVSQSGFPSAETYLLDLKTLSWSKPAPPAGLQQGSPAARSSVGAISGPDVAANSRTAFLLYGGTGSNQEALSDAWEFDFQFQFWSQVQQTGGPSAAQGVTGGFDARTAPSSTLDNTYYVLKSGGTDSGLWSLDISGTLASNIPDGVRGSWSHKSVPNIPSFADSASTVLGQRVVSIGGCTNPANNSCGFIVDGNGALTTVPSCASPRTGASVIPNYSTASSGFASQIFLLSGTLDADWQDGDGLARGEIAVLDINTGTWSRLIPSVDPSAQGSVPRPRQGAAISVLPGAGGSSSASDIIVFGGRDASGSYLNDVWILRAYNGVISPSSPHWSGFGDGNLQSGYEANGAGVINQYLSQCASHTSSPGSSTSSHPPNPTGTSSSPTGSNSSNSIYPFDTSISHKVLSPVSAAVLLLLSLLHRVFADSHQPRPALTLAIYITLVVAYGIGVAGLIIAFTSITSNPTSSSLSKRSTSSLNLKSAHGQAGLAFGALLYGLVPLLFLWTRFNSPKPTPDILETKTSSRHSEDKRSQIGSVLHKSSPPSGSPRPQSLILANASTTLRTSHDRSDDETVSMNSAGPQRTFEVLNRPQRRRPGGTSHLSNTLLQEEPRAASRSLSEMDWLQRRRSLNAVGELDYAIGQAIRAQEFPPTPATTDALMTGRTTTKLPTLPSTSEIIAGVTLQLSLCGACIISLIALWTRPRSKVFFALFLALTVLSYVLYLISASRGHPSTSVLSFLFVRLRGSQPVPHSLITQTPEQYRFSNANTPTPLINSPGYPFPPNTPGPYTHHNPPHRMAAPDDTNYTSTSPRSVETDDDDEEDEDVRQQRIESEMGRRDVSIVTVPKRKLWIANPS